MSLKDVLNRSIGRKSTLTTAIKNWPSFTFSGLKDDLTVPLRKFEVFEGLREPHKMVKLPLPLFNVPIRKDVLHLCNRFYKLGQIGYNEKAQITEYEWKGSNRKFRKHYLYGTSHGSGKARMARRKSGGKYEGVHDRAKRPKDFSLFVTQKTLAKSLLICLTAKFVQKQIHVFDNFYLTSHKTKHAVAFIRHILGRRARDVLFCYDGKRDLNDNFRLATANIFSVKRVEAKNLNVFLLLKNNHVFITSKALSKITNEIYKKLLPKTPVFVNLKKNQTFKVKLPKLWKKMKNRERNFEDRVALLKNLEKNFKWNHNFRGPYKTHVETPRRPERHRRILGVKGGFSLKDECLYDRKAMREFDFNSVYKQEDSSIGKFY